MENTKFKELLNDIETGNLVSATITSPREKNEVSVLKITIRSIIIKQQSLYQITNHYKQQVTHRNLNTKECALLVKNSIPSLFQQGVFNSTNNYYHLLVNKNQQVTVVKKSTKTEQLNTSHNRTKKHIFEEGIPHPFLIELGIMNSNGTVIAKKYDKFRQINRFIELVNDVMPHLSQDRSKPLEIIDFGCGKASLTFALYHYLCVTEGRVVHITGLDLKKEVIERCQILADQLGYTGLRFAIGDISNHQHQGKIDLVISLHACNTATDAAIERAVYWDADVILCVPCCQHELYQQIENKDLHTLLRHGILKERFAALATDAARAELLTILGYDVQVLEFIDMEHTPKNLLLRAVKNNSENQRESAKERYKLFKETLKITPTLEKTTAKKIDKFS